MAKRNKSITKNTASLIGTSVSTLNNLATIADNITGMIADGSDVIRDITPNYISKQLDKASKLSELEDELEALELQAQIDKLKSTRTVKPK